MKRFKSTISSRTRSRTTAVLIFAPVLLAGGCDMGTYNKRLRETKINQPSAESAANTASARYSAQQTETR